MMQQQLLLILLGIILVGAAVALGFSLMSDQASATNRDHVSSDLLALVAKAQSYFRRPISYGGGDGSFNGLTIFKLVKDTTNANGSYSIVGSVSPQGPVRMRGLGNESGNDRINPVRVEMLVYPDTVAVDISALN